MRFMLLVKSNADAEAGEADETLRAAMGKLNEEMAKAGVLRAAEGLQPSSKGFRIRGAGGALTVTDGPFPEPNRLIAGYWILDVKSKEEAVAWAERVPFEAAGGAGLGEIDVFPIQEQPEGEAFALPPPPAMGPGKMRFLMMFKANAKTEAEAPPNEKTMQDMGALVGEMVQAGKFLSGDGLRSSSKATRVRFANGERTVTDGPFTETKELVAGFATFLVSSKEEAIEIAKRGVLVNGDCESEARLIGEFPAAH
jgi:hypothetical protein